MEIEKNREDTGSGSEMVQHLKQISRLQRASRREHLHRHRAASWPCKRAGQRKQEWHRR